MAFFIFIVIYFFSGTITYFLAATKSKRGILNWVSTLLLALPTSIILFLLLAVFLGGHIVGIILLLFLHFCFVTPISIYLILKPF